MKRLLFAIYFTAFFVNVLSNVSVPNLSPLPELEPSFGITDNSLFGEYIGLGLVGFQLLYTKFNTDCVPFFARTVADIRTKIGEFKKMIGVQEFLSLGSLYSQYIPLNVIVNHHILLQSKQLSNLATSSLNLPLLPTGSSNENVPASNAPLIKFVSYDYTLLQNAYAIFSKGNVGIIQSVVRTINALQAAANSTTLNVTGDTLEMSSQLAQAIYEGLRDFSNSVQDIYVGSKTFATNFNVTKVQKYQNNADCAAFIKDLYTFLSGASHINKAYAKAAKNQANVFLMVPNNNGTIFKTNITTMNNIINDESLKIAAVFGSTDSIDDKQQNEINKLSQ